MSMRVEEIKRTKTVSAEEAHTGWFMSPEDHQLAGHEKLWLWMCEKKIVVKDGVVEQVTFGVQPAGTMVALNLKDSGVQYVRFNAKTEITIGREW